MLYEVITVAAEDVGVLPGVPAAVAAGGAVLADQVRAFAEPPVVLAVVAAGLGDVVAEGQDENEKENGLWNFLPIESHLALLGVTGAVRVGDYPARLSSSGYHTSVITSYSIHYTKLYESTTQTCITCAIFMSMWTNYSRGVCCNI